MLCALSCLCGLALYSKKFSVAGKSKYIKVVDRVSFGLDKHLVLVKVGKEHFLFLLGKKDFQTVAKVEIDDETAEKEQDNEEKETAFNFREIFDKYVGKDLKKTRTGPQNSQKEETPDRNETMRENIERLRKMQEKSFDKEV
ncbi:flagellar biosynthetic protein FliO [Thermoclostridium stercorarium]|uniref:flagellar biosynthetic protein FliO n=1 Tax=Thermoclostridium stercorarium TaxID=1510 RepID=UPI0034E4C57C